MKKIKFLSSLLEQNPSLSDLTKGTDGLTQPTTNKPADTGKSTQKKGGGGNTEQTDKPATASPEAERTAKEPWATLLKLSSSTMSGEKGVTITSVKKEDGSISKTENWPWAVSWTTTGGEIFNPESKGVINANKTYYFQTEGGSDVSVAWWKSEDAESHKYLYSGTYAIGGGKITITGLEGQSEIIDVASSKVTGNVGIVPASGLELNAVKMRFGNQAPILGWYFFMKMYNLKTESPELYKIIESGLTAKGYSLWTDTDWVLNRKNMTINTSYFKDRETYYWPVVKKIFSQFAAGQERVPFCSITDLNSSITVTTDKGTAKQKTTTFASGYEYLTKRLQDASKSTDFDPQEAYCFYTVLAALSKSAISTINQFATTAGISFNGKDTWEGYVLDQCGGNWPVLYAKYVKPLQETDGKAFPNTAFASAEGSSDAKWFESVVKMYALGGDHLKDALSRVPAYSAPVQTPSPWVNPMPSDIRLKENIELIGKSNSGLNIYKFKYKDQEGYYQGVMAQELLETEFNSAVVSGEEFYSVNYDLIDVEFKQILN